MDPKKICQKIIHKIIIQASIFPLAILWKFVRNYVFTKKFSMIKEF